MTPRQARRERREAERKAKKLNLKKARLAGAVNSSPVAVNTPVTTQPRWNLELEAQRARPRAAQQNRNPLDLGATRLIPSPSCANSPKDEFPRDLQSPPNAMLGRAAPQDDSLPQPTTPANGFVSQNPPSRADINRSNAQRSTGPRSLPGKLAASRNSLKHGLASGQIIIPGEDPAAFDALLNDLLGEHQPATPTEQLLIKEMAQSQWLTQRAIRLQNQCFTEDGVNEKQLALFLRYQTTHQRAFYKAFSSLLRLKKDAARAQSGFVSQPPPQPDQFVRQNAPAAGFVSQNALAITDLHGGGAGHGANTQAA